MLHTYYMKPYGQDELRRCIESARGAIDKVYLHWTAGKYDQVFDDYHISIDKDGRLYLPDPDLTLYRPHTWKRNSYAVGIALNCAYGAEARNGYDAYFGQYPPTPAQVEAMALAVALFGKHGDIPITPEHVMTPCEAAFIDGYGPGSGDPETRWDLWYLQDFDGNMRGGGNVIRGKALWYANWSDI